MEPLWRGDAGGFPEIMRSGWVDARFFGDVLLLERGNTAMAAVNPATGDQFWAADPAFTVGTQLSDHDEVFNNLAGRAPIVKRGGDWLAFVNHGFVGYVYETSVAAVRMTDAEMVWQMNVPVGHFEAVDADEKTVLLTVAEELDSPVARVVRLEDRVTLWEAPGVWPHSLAGQRVLGTVSSRPPTEVPQDSVVVGMDAATGKQVWRLGRFDRSEIGFVAGDLALVYGRVAGIDRDAVSVVDVTTGDEVDELGWDLGNRNRCATDGVQLIACALDEYGTARLVTYDIKRRTKYVSRESMSDVVVTNVWRGRVFVRDLISGADWAMDADGAALSDKLPGALLGLSDDYAAFSLPGSSVIAVYQNK